jgi:O-antigen/teichoic acid export membrane protein
MSSQSRNKYLAKNILLFSLSTFGTRIISFFLVPIYTNTLSTSQYGVADLITTLVTILSPIITMNIGEGVMRFCLDENANYDEVSSIGYLFGILSIFIGLLIFPINSLFKSTSDYSFLIYHYCVSLGLYTMANYNLRGREKLLQFAIANIIQTLSAAVLNILFLVILKMGVNGYFLAFIISDYIGMIYSLAVGNFLKTLRHFKIRIDLLKQMITYSVVLVPNSFMWWIMNSSDRVMVTSMMGSSANGIYGVSYKIPSVLSVLSSVFNQAWNYSAIHENNSDDIETYTNNMYATLLVLVSMVTGFLMLIMKPLLSIYVAKDYYSAWMYTPYLLIGNFLMVLGTFLSSQYTVNKDSKGFLFSATTGAICNVALNFILIPLIGISGAALATCISYFMVFIYRVFDTRKYVRVHAINKKFIANILALIVIAISMFKGTIIGIIVYILLILYNRQEIQKLLFMMKGLLSIKKNG